MADILFLGTATDVKEYPLEPVHYRACENHDCEYNQTLVVDYDFYRNVYIDVCCFPNCGRKCKKEDGNI